MAFIPHFYVGPWHWATSVDPDRSGYGEWVGPAGAEYWAIDYRPTAATGIRGGPEGVAIFITRAPVLDLDYTLLGIGDWTDIKSNLLLRDAVPHRRGVTLDADDLRGLIFQSLMTGDPSGGEFTRNLGAGVGRKLQMRYGPLDYGEAFGWDSSAHRSAVRDKLWFDLREIVRSDRAEAATYRALASEITGKTWQQVQASTALVVTDNRVLLRWSFERGASPTQTATHLNARADKLDTHYRRVMGSWLDKFDLDASRWQEFVPADMRSELEPPQQPETTLSESFDQGDSTTVGPTYSWTEFVLDFSTVSNKLKDPTGFSTTAGIRADSDLSSDDHYCQADVTFDADTTCVNGEVSVRFSSSAHSCYAGGGSSSDDLDKISKITAGTRSLLASQVHTIGAETLTTKLTVGSGGDSNLDLLVGASALSTTDTTFTGQTRCGCSGVMVNNSARNHQWDNWTAADLVVEDESSVSSASSVSSFSVSSASSQSSSSVSSVSSESSSSSSSISSESSSSLSSVSSLSSSSLSSASSESSSSSSSLSSSSLSSVSSESSVSSSSVSSSSPSSASSESSSSLSSASSESSISLSSASSESSSSSSSVSSESSLSSSSVSSASSSSSSSSSVSSSSSSPSSLSSQSIESESSLSSSSSSASSSGVIDFPVSKSVSHVGVFSSGVSHVGVHSKSVANP